MMCILSPGISSSVCYSSLVVSRLSCFVPICKSLGTVLRFASWCFDGISVFGLCLGVGLSVPC